MLGDEGSDFGLWAIQELRAYGKHAYDPATNTFACMLTDGTRLSSADVVREGYFGKPGKSDKLDPIKGDGTFFWAYAIAYRMSGDEFMWRMARDIGRSVGIGDLDTAPGPDSAVECSDPMVLLGLLELHKAKGQAGFLGLARRVGDNILEQRVRNGFFVQSQDHLHSRFDALEPLALLTLAATIQGKPESAPEAWPSKSYFHCPFDGVGRTRDNDVIYSVLRSGKPARGKSDE
jgi:hypothetical protein